jgi:hypothetical protein
MIFRSNDNELIIPSDYFAMIFHIDKKSVLTIATRDEGTSE